MTPLTFSTVWVWNEIP